MRVPSVVRGNNIDSDVFNYLFLIFIVLFIFINREISTEIKI